MTEFVRARAWLRRKRGLHVCNGHVRNGHVCNGHVRNGHVRNGHVCNGHVCNGHAHTGVARGGIRREVPDGATHAAPWGCCAHAGVTSGMRPVMVVGSRAAVVAAVREARELPRMAGVQCVCVCVRAHVCVCVCALARSVHVCMHCAL